ncbi:MAG TPA: hypothetical protein PKA36_07090 [Pseudoxanthomonas mexicana]|nr:hypothetical protein [Pseudoxanthomonas mexicana]
MDNVDFLGVVAGHIEAGTLFRSGVLSNAEIAAKVRNAVRELKELRAQRLVMTDAARDMLAERRRQIEAEGWSPEQDDQHSAGQLAGAAGCYARHVNARGWVIDTPFDNYATESAPMEWPWADSWWKPTTPRRDLVKAGALILAEIERLDRAAYDHIHP